MVGLFTPGFYIIGIFAEANFFGDYVSTSAINFQSSLIKQ